VPKIVMIVLVVMVEMSLRLRREISDYWPVDTVRPKASKGSRNVA
jgi:hypothetical protein